MRIRTAAAVAAAAAALSGAAAPAALAASSDKDTIYVYDEDVAKHRGNDAEVCHFHFNAANFEAGETVTWWVEYWTPDLNGHQLGEDALSGTLTVDDKGEGSTASVDSLANGNYKLYWERKEDEVGPKRFTVTCAASSASASASPSESESASASASPSESVSDTPSPSESNSESASESASASASPSPSASVIVGSPDPTATTTATATASASASSTAVVDGDDLAETGASVGMAAALAAGCLAVGAVMIGRSRRTSTNRRH